MSSYGGFQKPMRVVVSQKGLWDATGLAQVEALMLRLAVGDRATSREMQLA